MYESLRAAAIPESLVYGPQCPAVAQEELHGFVVKTQAGNLALPLNSCVVLADPVGPQLLIYSVVVITFSIWLIC